MIKLPHWILSNKFPAFYDSESQTAIEMVSRVYGAMNDMIEEFNSFITKIEKDINNYEQANDEEREVFETALRQEFQDFIDIIDLKVRTQDQVIDEAKEYITDNINKVASLLVNQKLHELLNNSEFNLAVNYDSENEELSIVTTLEDGNEVSY